MFDLRMMVQKNRYQPETKAYIARVVADGGAVISPVMVDAAFKFAKSQNILASCLGWYATYAGIKKDGSSGATSKLYSLSGAAHDLVQATGLNQPIWSANVKNGLPALAFGGGSVCLQSAAYTVNQPFDVYLIVKPNEWRNGYGMFDGLGTNYKTYIGNGGVTPNIKAGAGTSQTIATSQVPVGEWHHINVLFNGASSHGYVDGVDTAGTINPGTGGAGGITMGALAAGGFGINTTQGELIVLGTSSAPRSAISSRLKTVWGTP